MGTSYSVKCEIGDEELLRRAELAVSRALLEVDKSMSTYREDSEVSVFNRLEAGKKQTVSPELMAVLELSQSLFEVSDGALDITVGPLVRAWGFGARAETEAPSGAELARLRKVTGFTLLTLEPPSSISKRSSGVEIDLSSVAKGYGVDQAARALEALGVRNYLVEVGGEIRFLGEKPVGEGKTAPWTLAIEEPSPEGRRVHGSFEAPRRGGALATSGDYRNFLEREGEVVSHLLDPRAGRPVPRRTASVSVLRPSAAEADGLATALSVLEPDEAIALADREGWAVYLLEHQPDARLRGRSSKAFLDLSFERVSSGKNFAP
jgi:thiamine biosynthesis lipoprotein